MSCCTTTCCATSSSAGARGGFHASRPSWQSTCATRSTESSEIAFKDTAGAFVVVQYAPWRSAGTPSIVQLSRPALHRVSNTCVLPVNCMHSPRLWIMRFSPSRTGGAFPMAVSDGFIVRSASSPLNDSNPPCIASAYALPCCMPISRCVPANRCASILVAFTSTCWLNF